MLTSDPTLLACFDRVVKAVSGGGQGITLPQLAAAHALARALVSPTRDEYRIRELARDLRIDAASL